MKKNLINFNILAIICLFLIFVTQSAWSCDHNDPGCDSFNSVSGIINTDSSHTFGDTDNGGWSNINGGMYVNSQGTDYATFEGTLDGTAEGTFNNNGETADAEAKLIFSGHGTNGDTGFSDVIADGLADETSFMSNTSNTDWYANTGQRAHTAFSAGDSTTERELNFDAIVSAQGSSGYTFTSTDTSRALTVKALNETNTDFTGDGTTNAGAMNTIAGGAMLNGTVAEFAGSSNITCPESGTAWTNGTGSINIDHTPTTNGFKVRADISVSEASGH